MEQIINSPVVEAIKKGLSYKDYRLLVKNLLNQKKTTGENHSESMVHYTFLNDKRMDRIDKTIQLSSGFDRLNLENSYYWLLITEGWCGDAAQSVPVIASIASLLPKIELRIILRDEYPEVIDQYLTNGGRSIPKLISVAKDSLKETGTWGPRPAIAQKMVSDYKNLENKPPYDEFVKELQLWYAKDKTQSIQDELLDFLKQHQ